jgi:hypothetical protein
VHKEVEDVHEGEGNKEGEQQEVEEGDSEGDEIYKDYVATGFVDEGEGDETLPERVTINVHWKSSPRMMMMMMMMMMMCPRIGRTTISHSVLLTVVRMCAESTRRMRLQ